MKLKISKKDEILLAKIVERLLSTDVHEIGCPLQTYDRPNRDDRILCGLCGNTWYRVENADPDTHDENCPVYMADKLDRSLDDKNQ